MHVCLVCFMTENAATLLFLRAVVPDRPGCTFLFLTTIHNLSPSKMEVLILQPALFIGVTSD